MLKQIRNVFQDKILWSLEFQNLGNVVEEHALLCTLKTELLTCLRKRLTGETCSQNIMSRHIFCINKPYVTFRPEIEVHFIQVAEVFFPFGCKNANTTKLIKCQMETAKASEKIDETKCLHHPCFR